LQEIGKEFGVLASLQILEPRLTKLSVLATPTGPLIHGDIGLGRMVPVPMMGEGLGRLLTLLVATTASRHGLLMVDEIDTGLHYSVMADVWTALAKTAREAEVQVFATTHSWECLKAAHESFSRNGPHDLRVHRLDRTEEGIAATTYDREMLGVALSSGMEIR
jgi:AAA15 family ATPase/GTPase